MICVNCGREFEGNFCPSCGEPVPIPTVCKKCGATFEGNFCTNCGTPFDEEKKSNLDILIDKFGNKIDIYYVAAIYRSKKQIKRFLMLATDYSPAEIEERTFYIYENVEGHDYGIIQCFFERGKFNEKYMPKNQLTARMFFAVIIGVLVSVLFFSGMYSILKRVIPDEQKTEFVQSEDQSQKSESIVAISVSASNLLDEYETNQIAADKAYKDQYLSVTGVLSNIGEDILGNVYITINNGASFELYSVQCYFSSSEQIDKIANLSPGDSVTVTGICDGKSLNVLLSSCSLP